MRILGRWLTRDIAVRLMLLLLIPSVAVAAEPQQEAIFGQQAGGSSSGTQSQNVDSGAGTVKTRTSPTDAGQLPNSPGTVRSQPVGQVQHANSPQTPPSQQPQQGGTREPVGTAAAEMPNTTGIAASKPAGAAIAPAKQRRVRILLIKVAAVVGAGVAVGTVAALASGSPSRPPGSR
jgi:hypothetical protein